jgi:uncharacterized protein
MGLALLRHNRRHALTSLRHIFQNVPVTTDKLESLSLEELYALADRTGLDLPPGLARPFVIEEILDVLEEDSEDRRSSQGEALHIDEKKYSELRIDEIDVDPGVDESMTARYNETMIRAIVRDPSWAFAYWDVSDAELGSLRGDESSAGLFLRVAEICGAGDPGGSDNHREYFDIPVTDSDLQWYINLPRSGVRFRIDLCTRRAGQGGKFRVLARSNEVESPRQSLATPREELEAATRELLALSGIEELSIDGRADGNPRCILQSGPAKAADRAD